MLRKLILLSTFWIVCAASFVAASAGSPVSQNSAGTVCWPLHFAGITLGITNDSQVRRLLGDGIHRPSEGDGGGRYFVDESGRATLHVVTYTDRIVGELTVAEGLDSSLQKDDREKAVSRFFDPNEGFGNWHALHLGASKADVLANLGNPARKVNDDSWEYSTSCTCELPQFFTVHFENGRLFKVVFAAPAG